jgi:hypothetical protein
VWQSSTRRSIFLNPSQQLLATMLTKDISS